MKTTQQGSIFIFVIIIIFIFIMVMLPVIANILAKMELLRLTVAREQAFQIAEAGRNYYEWHFLKFPNDYADGTGIETEPGQTYGPFTHDYKDYETQTVIGSYDLYITVPPIGGEIKIIKSIGRTTAYPNVTRTVEVRYQKNNVAQYSVFTNSPGFIFTDIKGKVYSTSGIRDMMPYASGQIISEKYNTNATYSCPIENLSNCVATKPGIWSDICPLGQTCCNQQKQCIVDGGGKPCSVDGDCETELTDARAWWTKTSDRDTVWTGIISDSLFNTMKNYSKGNSACAGVGNPLVCCTGTGTGTCGDVKGYISATEGIILGSSSNNGASIVFNSNGTYDVYRVATPGASHPGTYWDGSGSLPTGHSEITDYGTAAGNRVQINCTGGEAFCVGNSYRLPSQGVIYVDNGNRNLWVEGTVKGRVTVVTAYLPYNGNNAPSIFIPNNIVYDASCSGDDCAIGLISQNYILISYGAPDNIEIVGALITQYKSIGRLNYPYVKCTNGVCEGQSTICSQDSDCGEVNKGTLKTFGAFISNGKSYFGYSDPFRGYIDWDFNYDSNFVNNPPPYFPPKTQQYMLIYWKSD